MRVVVVDQKGPKVNGYFALATEIHDDSGAPHTLEHLCFMGSKSYSYKGLLDKLATRAYSTTNAWTATDQTAYTLDTAGWDGFAQILPIYLEHLIVPTLTDAACYTEVWHIDGSGNDAGVVYSEMQGVQNAQAELMDLCAKRAMYPKGNGFRYETGGMMEQLRVLTADRIREFHKEMYQPKNMCLVITGEVDHDNLLHILDSFEDTIVNDVPSMDAPFVRPWVESAPTPPLKASLTETVQFPEEDESMGETLTGFMGPTYGDHIGESALNILLTYLCGSSISVLENTLVEKEQLCSMIYYSVDFRPRSGIWFGMSAVETEKLASAEKRLIDLLKETVSKEFDMDYMRECLKRIKRQILLRCENAGDFFSTSVIEDHLFGQRDGSDLKELSTLQDFAVLDTWTDSEWRAYMRKYFVDAPHVSILGVPSKELSEKMTKDEKARVAAQKEKLGEDGLKRLAEELRKAQETNDKPIPTEVLGKFPIPSTDSIHFIPTVTARAGAAKDMGKLDNEIQKLLDQNQDGSPLFIHFEHIPSNFVRIKLILGTALVPVELKPLLTLYMMNFFTTPVVRSGENISFEDVVLELEKETVAYSVDSEAGNSEMLAISFNTEPEKYETTISWLQTLLFDAVHDPVRLHASVTKILADVPDEKRSGSSMMYAVNSMIQHQPESSTRARNTLAKALYLKRIKKMLKDDPDAVIEKFRSLCDALHRPQNFRVYVAANVEKLPSPITAWRTLTHDLDLTRPLQPLDDRKATLSSSGHNPGSSAFIVPMATIDSSFALLTSKGVDSSQHPDLPALMVAISYMDAVEGPLWVGVRGKGLAYGTGFSRSTHLGLLTFRIYRSPDAYKAFLAARTQIQGHADGTLPLDEFALEGAISEIVLRMADEQPDMASAADTSFTRQVMQGNPKDWSHAMLRKVRDVTPAQIRAAMATYLLPVFSGATANLVVTCAQVMREELADGFRKAGFECEIRGLEKFQDDYGLVGDPDADEEEEDDDNDDDDDDDDDEDDEDGDDEMDG
nr:uncharacterized protein c3h1.02c [Quercus suber]